MFPNACRARGSFGNAVVVSPPTTPTNLTPTGQTGAIALAWTAVVGATSYDVAISSDGGSTYGSPINVGTNAYTDSSATTNMQASTGLVYYKVRAVNAAGNSSYTSAVSASPFAFYDTFTGSSTTSLASHALTIGPSAWTVSSGAAWSLNASNRAQTTGSTTNGAAYIDAGVNDCTVQVTLATAPSGTGYFGPALRYQDASNCYAVIIHKGDNNIYLKRNVTGTGTNVASAAATIADGDVITANCSGNTIKVYQNGALKLTYSSASEFHSVNNFGLFASSVDATGAFDDFKITIP